MKKTIITFMLFAVMTAMAQTTDTLCTDTSLVSVYMTNGAVVYIGQYKDFNKSNYSHGIYIFCFANKNRNKIQAI